MRTRFVIPVLLAVVVLLVVVQLASATPPGSPLAQATGSPAAQETSSPAAQGTPEATPAPPSRGCLSCHVQIADDGRYTLAFEAMERMKAQGMQHPPLPFDTKLETCLTCHNGNVAKPMSSIVHPAHMFSPIFTGERGNCFSCHEIMNDEFTVLSEAQPVNDKGVIHTPAAGSGTSATPAATPTP